MNRSFFIGVILITIICNSCNHKPFTESNGDETEIVQLNNAHFVSLANAMQLAQKQKSPLDKSTIIDEYFEFKRNGKLAEFYIINYCKSGFAIISADDRLSPVLAYSENSHFPLRDNNWPYGVTDWLNSTSALIDSIRNNKMGQDISAKHHWETAKNGNNNLKSKILSSRTTQNGNISSIIWVEGEGYDQDDCGYEGHVIAEYFLYVPQLLNTTWGQIDGYNESLTYNACTTTTNGKYPVGCVPVAVGQVMNINRIPSSFNWDNINAGGITTNNFLRDLGLPANLNVNYDCSGSSASLSNAVTYLHSIGYSQAATTNSINISIIQNNLSYSYPVILAGGSHVWVCDGIQSYYNVVCYVSGANYDTREDLNMNMQFLHMNWGYEGDFDGWFSIWDYTPGPYNFNSNNILVYDIK